MLSDDLIIYSAKRNPPLPFFEIIWNKLPWHGILSVMVSVEFSWSWGWVLSHLSKVIFFHSRWQIIVRRLCLGVRRLITEINWFTGFKGMQRGIFYFGLVFWNNIWHPGNRIMQDIVIMCSENTTLCFASWEERVLMTNKVYLYLKMNFPYFEL